MNNSSTNYYTVKSQSGSLCRQLLAKCFQFKKTIEAIQKTNRNKRLTEPESAL
jgi:hypothetical protein